MSGPKLDPARRRAYGTRFGRQAGLYDRVRPGYPDACLDALTALQATSGTVCDLGAGTGKLGAALAQKSGAKVVAIDPDAGLLAHNPCESRVGTAEAIPLEHATISLVVVAQAWHWLDAGAAVDEIARVLQPGGHVAVVNNQLDVRVGWVLRLSRIMHAGDVYRPEWRPRLSPDFGPVRPEVFTFTQRLSVDQVVDLARTRTYWLRAGDAVRTRVEHNIREYLTGEAPEDPDFAGAMHTDGSLELPYLCLLYTAGRKATRSGSGGSRSS